MSRAYQTMVAAADDIAIAQRAFDTLKVGDLMISRDDVAMKLSPVNLGKHMGVSTLGYLFYKLPLNRPGPTFIYLGRCKCRACITENDEMDIHHKILHVMDDQSTVTYADRGTMVDSLRYGDRSLIMIVKK
jgi:hypothetical protein